MNKKKILFLIDTLGSGGAEKVLVNLVNNLDRNKYDITVQTVCNIGINKQFLKNNIKYKYFFNYNIKKIHLLFLLFSPKLIHKLFIKEKYDIEIAYIHGPVVRIISGCQNKNTKLISWIHGTKTDKNNASKGFRNFNEANNCYSRFDKIMCVSGSVEKSFNKLFHSETKTQIIYNVNETDKITDLSKENIDFEFNRNEFNIISVGSLSYIKGFDRLIRVQKKLIENNYKSHIYILGTGSEYTKLKNLINENNLKNTWTFLGYDTNPYRYVSKADLFVCSSYQEALSTAVTEAMLLKIPVVTTECSGMKEILGNNETGLIVKNNEDALFEGIKYLIDNPEKLEYYKKQAEKRSRMFSKDILIKQHEELFDGILNDKCNNTCL